MNKSAGLTMIVSFKSKMAHDLFHGIASRYSRQLAVPLWTIAQRKLDMLNSAFDLKDLQRPPSNRLEKLKGYLSGAYSLRINDQFRIVFKFKDGNAHEVDILDYH